MFPHLSAQEGGAALWLEIEPPSLISLQASESDLGDLTMWDRSGRR